ncbi:hypothetical protein EUX98_g1144 [Antrodiella citrinella]|uniref:Alpha/beta hydrolase fold-3 domain-containing protein n=1 Tax=Antrodiella citrinella TaxID=2447956 RepID=A0A4S4N276_9APHY|nr:hypothetical protein EUX98_g1144 [Antrodiella citrinella]
MNSLTREAGIKIGPLLLETAVKHYFERILKDHHSQGKEITRLRQDELLYDEAFNIVKTFLEASTKHTVEELQQFSNMRTLSPPWVHVVRLCVPMSSCDDAAAYLIKALGGEEVTKRLVGGTKWWQVRGVSGVDAEWIATKKDWQKAEKRHKAHERATSQDDEPQTKESKPGVPPDAPDVYQPEMDEMRCILYVHGGGYYFGSVDQERYSIQRYARKVNGRVFVVAGDSAGGGLCIALLQVLRDTGLPLPAGGILISPWCDLTHSFPSIHTNTATDVIPPYGLSLYKPSTLWPPPPDDITLKVQESVRSRIRQAIHFGAPKPHVTTPHSPVLSPPGIPVSHEHDLRLPEDGRTLHLGSTASLPIVNSDREGNQTIKCTAADGQVITIDDQIHLYAPNYLLTHPLISPVVSYLGGLPPLFVIASDKEVLRDEVIFFAHKAAHADKYTVSEETRKLYPALEVPNGGSYFLSRDSKSPRSGSLERELTEDVAGPRFHDKMESLSKRDDVRTAGEASVYANGLDTMIRERVSTRGVVRPLEPEKDLSAFALPPELIGVVSELAMFRYLDGRTKFDKKFHKTTKTIVKQRQRNLETASKDAKKSMSQLQAYLEDQQRAPGVREVQKSGSWSWAWALDADEHPPPSSIVSRRDTGEAVRLARIADQSVLVEENMMSGNSLWSMIVNFLTVAPEQKHSHHRHSSAETDRGSPSEPAQGEKGESGSVKREKFRSRFALFVSEYKKNGVWKKKEAA